MLLPSNKEAAAEKILGASSNIFPPPLLG